MNRRLLLAALLAFGLVGPLQAQEVVEKKTFEAGSYRTRGGATIAEVRIGYQTMGTLNAAGDNAVLICHYFSGNSNAFGRLDPNGPAGYWDAIIGPGKAIDTNRFFVISSDTLVNLNVPDQRTVTTGPASINKATGRPYGMDFPVVSIRDFVEVQKQLLDKLGVKRLALVAGPSMGALQVVEWAAAYPEMVERAMPVIGGEVDPWLIGWLEIWEAPIRLDPNWRNGDYYGPGREPPMRGLAEALKIVTLQANDRLGVAKYGRGAAEGEDPAHSMQGRFAIEKWLDDAAMARAKASDANSFLYLTRANQLFLNEYPSAEAALSRSQARWFVVISPNDRTFLREAMQDWIAGLRKSERPVETAEVTGPLGHLNGVVGMAPLAPKIAAFLQ
ncbi:MAG TPA: homoserine O-acetyltransferase [Crenalkalicoccus sp.]|nr:homoserine O-acetyltransferase [Crenalkalicoccus sp.]